LWDVVVVVVVGGSVVVVVGGSVIVGVRSCRGKKESEGGGVVVKLSLVAVPVAML
jgi:hypothetical protein